MIRHYNITQQAEATKKIPLVVNESPYINNLTRYAKNVYTYSDKVNEILSYGGYVSRLKAATTDILCLYRIVRILDGEVITNVTGYANKQDRFGIIVSEPDLEGYYLVCTFCPNFIFPVDIKQFDLSSELGVYLKLDLENYASKQCNLDTSMNKSGEILLGVVTGRHSMFFCGTTRIFSIFPPSTGLVELGFTYDTEVVSTYSGLVELGYNTQAFSLGWNNFISSRYDVSATSPVRTWNIEWDISPNRPINSLSFSQGSLTYGQDFWVVTYTGIINNKLQLTINETSPYLFLNATGSYSCTVTVNGMQFTAILTIEHVYSGS